jgi:hypothetical protein
MVLRNADSSALSQGSTGETAEATQRLLLESIQSDKEPTRLCAVQWAVK